MNKYIYDKNMPITLGPILEMLKERQDRALAGLAQGSETVVPELVPTGTMETDYGTMIPESEFMLAESFESFSDPVVPVSSNTGNVLLYGGTFLLGFGLGVITCHYLLRKKKT